MMRFVELKVHDGDIGSVNGVAVSFDDKYLLSVGQDGQFFVNRLKGAEILAMAEKKPTKYEEAEEEPGALKSRQMTTSEAKEKGTVIETLVSSAFSDPVDTKIEEALEENDIIDSAAYSIEDEKLKSEEDRAKIAAEKKKDSKDRS